MSGHHRHHGWRTATAFLTRVPVGAAVEAPAELARAVPWFPVVGAVVGLLGAAVYALAGVVLPPLAAAAVAIASTVILTGAFHEDGLADLADALGGSSAGDALRIMKDPAHGTFGVVALVLSLVVRVAAVASLDPGQAVAGLVAANAVARAGALVLLTAPPARRLGLGAAWASGVTGPTVMVAVAVGIGAAGAAAGAWAIPMAGVTAVGVGVVAAVAVRRLGGITGDVMGAAEQCAEILVLLLASALATATAPGFPWWR